MPAAGPGPQGPTVAAPVAAAAAVTVAATALVAIVAKPGGAKKPLEIDFGCNALRDCKLESTVEREVLEKQLQVAQTWCKVRSIDHATAEFKLKRVTPQPPSLTPELVVRL